MLDRTGTLHVHLAEKGLSVPSLFLVLHISGDLMLEVLDRGTSCLHMRLVALRYVV